MDDVARLAQRLQTVEDRLEIQDLIATHPLSVDSGHTRFWEERWTEGSHQDKLQDPSRTGGSVGVLSSRPMVIAEIKDPGLTKLQQTGLLHFPSCPHVSISGDTAVATTYSQLLQLEAGELRVKQLTVSRWELVRGASGWQVQLRIMRNIGTRESVELLRRGLDVSNITP